MTYQELAQKLATAIQTTPELYRILAEAFEDMEAGSDVTVTQVQTDGNKIASITVGEETTDIYSPEVEVTQTLQSGTEIAEIEGTKLYAPAAAAAAVFFDGTSQAIASGNINSGSVTHSSFEYTATEDCYFMITTGKDTQTTIDIKVEDKKIWSIGTGYSFNDMTIPVLLKNGQTYKVSGLGAYCSYVVRKVK